MKLLAYKINDLALGVDLTYWDNDDLNENEPFIIIQDNDAIPENYGDISSIETWKKFGNVNDFDFNRIREEIRKLRPVSITGLTESEIEVLNEYSLNKYYKIYDYINYSDFKAVITATELPINLDYDIIGLHKKRYFQKGELYKVEYYASYNPATKLFNDLIVKENRTYYRTDEMLNRREMQIIWYYNDNTSGATKNTVKYYNLEEAIVAGEVRRRNVISNLKINTVGLIMMTSGITQNQAEEIGLAFLDSYNTTISRYIEGVEQPLKTAILTDSNHSWLNNVIPNTGGITIRLYLYDNVNIDYTLNNTNTV